MLPNNDFDVLKVPLKYQDPTADNTPEPSDSTKSVDPGTSIHQYVQNMNPSTSDSFSNSVPIPDVFGILNPLKNDTLGISNSLESLNSITYDDVENVAEDLDLNLNLNSVEFLLDSSEISDVAKKINRAIDIRDKYMNLSLQIERDNPKNSASWLIYPPPPPPSWKKNINNLDFEDKDFDINDLPVPKSSDMTFNLGSDGVYSVKYGETNKKSDQIFSKFIPASEFFNDFDFILSLVHDGPTKTWTYKRLKYLEVRWQMYLQLYELQERLECKNVPHRDFYNVRKVDTHVHLASCMNQKHLLRFIKFKIKTEPDQHVIIRDGQSLSLKQVFQSLNLTAYEISIDTLDMHAHKDTFHRFDKFNLKYNPIGESRLRTIFLKTDNYIHGKYFSELVKQVFDDLESSKYQMAEYRVSIYGQSIDEWDKLAKWVINNKVVSHNVRWLIQVPRLYSNYKSLGTISSFQDIIYNIFNPLFEVTKNPSKYPELHAFLQRVVGFDSVDDESKIGKKFQELPTPNNWTNQFNPPYSYYCYYMYANITTLNQFRKHLGYNTFVFRPHAGEAGEIDNLVSAFLTSFGISHGILLRKAPVLQYMFYIKQIGIAMSPLSNNALFLSYERNPLKSYFYQGLNVSLSTDDPLQFHYTKEPLIEEYSVASQVYRFSNVDMCELALNSVIQSGFEKRLKSHWIGHDYLRHGTYDVNKTNVPSMRLNYRKSTLQQEKRLLNSLPLLKDGGKA
ncbi:AMP deaminase [Smittium mucronatum]|uniref:AMP deaminase n=1 Tax=Smittium mucronatum TaxID=133383 RepID=A0A1R0GM84_9FUNG|nr:AMP deaminase [Smittium mucronatum]OLY79281.1 AMP deaminase [Smittium mucronatum]